MQWRGVKAADALLRIRPRCCLLREDVRGGEEKGVTYERIKWNKPDVSHQAAV